MIQTNIGLFKLRNEIYICLFLFFNSKHERGVGEYYEVLVSLQFLAFLFVEDQWPFSLLSRTSELFHFPHNLKGWAPG